MPPRRYELTGFEWSILNHCFRISLVAYDAPMTAVS
jgi:hypothetical protein